MRNLTEKQQPEVLNFLSFLVSFMSCNNTAYDLLKAYNIILKTSNTELALVSNVDELYKALKTEFEQKVDYSMDKFPEMPRVWGIEDLERRIDVRYEFVGSISLTKWQGRGESQRRRLNQASKLWKEVARITKLANEPSTTQDVYEFLGQLTTMYAALYDETLFDSVYNWTWAQERLCELGKDVELGNVLFFGYLTRQSQGVKQTDANYVWEYTSLPM